MNRLELDQSVTASFSVFKLYDSKTNDPDHQWGPWWTNPELKINFFRPLSGLALYAQYHVFGKHPFFFHVVATILFLTFVYLWANILREFLPDKTAILALLIMVFSSKPIVATLWVANQNALIAAIFFTIGFQIHIMSRKSGNTGLLIGSVILYFIALLAGEITTSMLVFPLFYELYLQPDRSLYSKIKFFAALAAISIAYLAIYRYGQFGTFGSGLYVNPVREFPRWVNQFPIRFFPLLAANFFEVYIDPWALNTSTKAVFTLAGIISAVVVTVMYFKLTAIITGKKRKILMFFFVTSIVAMIPTTSGFPMTRLVFPAFLSTAVIVAIIMEYGFGVRRFCEAAPPHKKLRFLKFLAAFYTVVFLAITPCLWIVSAAAGRIMENRNERAFLDRSILQNKNMDFYVFSGYLPGVRFLTAMQRYFGQESPASFNYLIQTPYPYEILTASDRSLIVTIKGGGAMLEGADAIVNHCGAFKKDQIVPHRLFTVRILEANACGPTKFEITFIDRLENLRDAIFLYDNDTVDLLPLPPIGQSITIDLPVFSAVPFNIK